VCNPLPRPQPPPNPQTPTSPPNPTTLGKEYKGLHFECCYYQAIEEAIERKLPRVEAGAQGEHKMQRGYLPNYTYRWGGEGWGLVGCAAWGGVVRRGVGLCGVGAGVGGVAG